MANKTTIRAFFKAVRHGDLDLVRTMVSNDPALVSCCATAPPKKDDGQSPLQVALKTGKTSIANLLIDHGADVNFMETSSVNEWRAPALHDAVRGVVAWAGPRTPGFEGYFEAHFQVFQRMLDLGADATAADSFGNTCMDRAVMDAINKAATEQEWAGQTGEDFGRVVAALVARGADLTKKDRHGLSPLDWARDKPFRHCFGQ